MSYESVTGFYFSFVCAGVVVAGAGGGDGAAVCLYLDHFHFVLQPSPNL